ncbi:MAG TPA: ABC transporter ATP-binding protein [Micromonosporaceae bacterium]|nr:ABC transporter ATP-binding protein [Micromonosporaceae bacterium]
MTLPIEVEHLRLSYGSTTALDDVSFALPGGRIYGLLGRNGSGKTSLLSVLAGFRRAEAGAARIDGLPVFENPAVTSRVCLIRETADAAHADESIKDTLQMAADLRPGWDADYAAALLDRFGIVVKSKVGALSRGQRSAFGITIGLASRTPVTMYDESHLGMDAPTRSVFQEELLRDFTEHPRTIIISTHLIEEMSALFEEVLILDRGRLLVREDAETLRSRGASVTGPADAVDRFVDFGGFTRLGERQLGHTKSAMVYGEIDDVHRQQAREAGLELGPVDLQNLFTHLTEPNTGQRSILGGIR